MSDYGVTPTGFVGKRLDVVLDEMHTGLSEGLGVNTRLNPKSYLNVIVTNVADKITELWEVMQDEYGAMYPFSAEGLSLDNAAQFGGITREEARPTYYPIHTECVDGTVIPKGARIKSNTNPAVELIAQSDTQVTRNAFNRAKIRVVVRNNEVYSFAVDGQLFSYTSSANPSAPEILQGLCSSVVSDIFSAAVTSDGFLALEVLDVRKPCALTLSGNLTTESVTAIINYASEESGEIALPDGSITEIVTAVPGLISVVNLSGYIAGRGRESDVSLRKSYADKIFARSSRMLDSIKAAILLNVQGIMSIEAYENDQDEMDAFGRPPHSIEVIVEGGDDVQIATVIEEYKSGGIQTFGAVETVVPGDSGEPITIRFNRPTTVYLWYRVTVTLNGNEQLPIDYVALVTEAVRQYTADVEIGSPIVPKRINTAIYRAVAGDYYTAEVEAFPTHDIGASPGEFSAAVIPMTIRERAVTDTARIEVVLSG
jgi:uncharacterized phage protein gp47/JayE